MKTESPREVAERIVQTYYPDDDELLESILTALNAERERCAKILEARADELQAEWDQPPCAKNAFMSMTADTPAGYATFWGINSLRKLANKVRGTDAD